jgi:hypothetical protein
MNDKTDIYLVYDIEKVSALRNLYHSNMLFIQGQYNFSLSSNKQIKEYLADYFGLTIKNVTIKQIADQRDNFAHDTEIYDILNGIVTYLRLKYTIKNYLDCILRHEKDGKLYLRLGNGELLFPNKRPLSRSPEIEGCIIAPPTKEKYNGSHV